MYTQNEEHNLGRLLTEIKEKSTGKDKPEVLVVSRVALFCVCVLHRLLQIHVPHNNAYVYSHLYL